MKTPRYALIGAVALVVITGMVGCLVPSDRDIAGQIEAAIRTKVHPTGVTVALHRISSFSTRIRTLDITITGFTADSLPLTAGQPIRHNDAPVMAAGMLAFRETPRQGHERMIRVSDAHLRCEQFTLHQLPVQELDLKIHETRFPLESAKRGNLAITSAESAGGYAVFTESGLTQFLRTRTLPIKDVTVQLTQNECIIKGETKDIIGVAVQVSGRIIAKDGAVLYLERPKLKVLSLTLPKVISDRILREINPLADLNTELPLPAPLTITGITHNKGSLRFDGTLQFPQGEK